MAECVVAQSNSGQLGVSLETLFDEDPTTPNLQLLPFTSSSIGLQKETVQSQTIRPDRSVDDVIRVGANAAGDIGFENRTQAFDSLYEAVVAGTPVVVTINAATDISVDNPTRAFNSTTTDFVAAGIVVGMNIAIAGSPNAANVAVFQVETVTTNQIVVPDTTLVTEAAGASFELRGRMTRNGSVKRSFLLETGYTDISRFQPNTGMRIANLSMQLQARQIITGTFTLAGARTFPIVNTSLDATPVASPATPVTDASANVGTIRAGGVDLQACINSMSIEITNNTREINCIGALTPCSIGLGQLEVSGQIELFLDDTDAITLFGQLVSHTTTSLRIPITDNAGQHQVITMDRVYFTEGVPAITGLNTDISLPLSYTAVFSPVSQSVIQFDLPALAV